jgi:LysM repeat protein
LIYYINSLITDIINHYLGGKIVGFISQPENKKSVVNGQSLSEPSTEELEADNLSDGTTIVAGDDASNPVSPISQYETKSGDSFWNIAKNQLPAGASNAQIQAQVLKLMELNPEIDPRGLQIGHQLNIIDPGSNITVSDTTMMNYNISDSEYRKDLEARLINNVTNKTFIEGLGEIPSYDGDLPSPLPLYWINPEFEDILNPIIKDSEIRDWVKSAAEYHDVPHELLALVLQQENAPNASLGRKILQFGEITLTTAITIVDEILFDIVPDKIGNKRFSGGSSGIANMSRATLRDAAEYTEKVYNKNPLSEDVRYRMFGYDNDLRIPGDDWEADLYYAAAHLRQLIDRETDTLRYSGSLTLNQTKNIIRRYNGSGPLAEKYSNDAMITLKNAEAGKTNLYFYEK